MKVHKVNNNLMLNDLVTMFLKNNDRFISEKAKDFLLKKRDDNYNFFLAYEEKFTSPIGYIIEIKDTVEEIFIDKNLRKKGYATKMLEILFENEKPNGLCVWHYEMGNMEALMRKWSKNAKTQEIEVEGKQYQVPLYDFVFYGETACVAPMTKEQVSEYVVRKRLKN